MTIVTRNGPPFSDRTEATVYIGETVNVGFRLQQPDGAGGWELQSYSGRVFGLQVYSDAGAELVNVLGVETAHVDGAYIACSIPGTDTESLAAGLNGWRFVEFFDDGFDTVRSGLLRIAAAPLATPASGPPGTSSASTTIYSIDADLNIITINYSGAPGHDGTVPSWGDLTGTLSAQTDLQAALDAKALATRTITGAGLVTGGGDLTANRTLTVTEASQAEAQAGTGAEPMTARRVKDQIDYRRGAALGLASLDAGGLVPTAQIPPLAISETYVVASQAAMLALTAQRGDVAVRTDLSKSFILATDSPTTLADWKELLAPAAPVQSVNGQTGTVSLAAGDVGAQPSDADLTAIAALSSAADKAPYSTGAGAWALYNLTAYGRTLAGSADAAAVKTSLALVKADVGLGSADDTSDASKPVSTPQQTALNLKLNTASPAATGTLSIDADVKVVRDAANAWAHRNGGNAQSWALYYSYTDAGNYDRFKITISASTITFNGAGAGTGSSKLIGFAPDGTLRWYFSNGASQLMPNATNTYDIGTSGIRVKTLYLATSLVTAALITGFSTKTADYTLTGSDHTIAADSTSGTITMTLPTAVGRAGQEYTVQKIVAANTVNVATTSAQTMSGAASPIALTTQWSSLTLKSDGANWLITARI